MSFGLQRSGTSLLKDWFAVILAVVVPATALPLASNRSGWWLIWTALLAGLALVYLAAIARNRGRGPRLLGHPAILTLALLTPIWAAVQTLPFADYLPPALLRMAPGLDDFAGSAISVQPDVALAGILRFLGYILLLGLVLEIASRRDRVLRVAQIVYAGVCLHAIWAVVALQLLDDFSLWGTKVAYQGSATGTFVNRNSLATFLGFGMVLGLGLLAERSQRQTIRATRAQSALTRFELGDLSIGLGLVFLFIALVATQSRLGLAASLIGIVGTLGLMRHHSGTPAFRATAEVAALVVLGLGLAMTLSAGGGVLERFLFVGNEAVNRMALYEQTIGMIALRPWTGFGMDAFASAFEAFRAPPLLAPVTYDMAHNTYLTLWVEFGLVFGSLPILALAAIGVTLWRRMRSDDGFCGLAMAGLGALAVAAIHSLGDFSLEIPANVYLLMLVLGLGLGRNRKPAVPPSRKAAPAIGGVE